VRPSTRARDAVQRRARDRVAARDRARISGVSPRKTDARIAVLTGAASRRPLASQAVRARRVVPVSFHPLDEVAMPLATSLRGPFLLCLLTGALAPAQDDGSRPAPAADTRVQLDYATFDPRVALPEVPPALRAGADTRLWIVQFHALPTDREREQLRAVGADVHGYLPAACHLVRMDHATAGTVATLGAVRWVGPYEPAYRLEPALLAEHVAGAPVPQRRYDLVVVDKRRDKGALEAKLTAIGGRVADRHLGSLLFSVELTAPQLLATARLDEVLWIERWFPPSVDMDNARIQGGANHVETAGGYTGSGIRGHLYEGAEYNHPDFTTNLTAVRSTNVADDHGHCTAGIIFGNGTSAPQARGMAPDAVGFFTNRGTVQAGWSRYMVLGDVVNVHSCMFTTASWGGAQTSAYTATSAEADDIVFDHRIPWTNSMSNLGNTNARPEAWAKNVISIGGVQHLNNSSALDDSWLGGNGSIGPAADGRMKPDLSAYYESVWTSDRSGSAGYSSGNSTTGFGGTSAATPIVAGHNALAIQMYTDHLFNNPPRVVGGTRFQNRPFAQTLKALMIASANQYTPAATDNRREHVGFGFPSLRNLYDRRNRFTVVPEDAPIQQGQTHTYSVNVLPGESLLKVCMTYLDPAGNPAAALDRVNDLTLRVIAPNSTAYWGNVGLRGASQTNFSATGGSANTIDTVECVFVQNPAAGTWTIQITAPTLTTDAHVATAATDATYALVVNGGTRLFGSGCARYVPDVSTTSAGANLFPFGGYTPSVLPTLFTGGNSLSGTVFFDVTVTNPIRVSALAVNVTGAAGADLFLDVWRTNAGVSHAGNEGNPVWVPMTAGRGVSAGANTPSSIELSEPFLLTPGVYGFAVQSNNFTWAYTNGNGTNQSYSNADVTISAGTSKSGAPGVAGTVFSPRVANIELQYRRDGVTGSNIRYQTIVRREELGTAGAIRGLSFSFAGTGSGRHWNDSLIVRMSHVPAGHTLSATFATNLPNPVTVLNANDYSFGYTADAWSEIGLQTPFAYNGTSDLVVEIIARGNWQTASGGFHDSDEPRVYDAAWTGIILPITGTVAADRALRMRVAFNCAEASEHGSSCGRLRATHSGDGRRGANFTFRVADAPTNLVAALSLGLSNTAPLPLSLTSFGWTNCIAWNDPVVLLTVNTDGSGNGAYVLAVPNNAALDGSIVFGQWFTFDTSEPGGLTFSNQTRLMVGVAP
jgi:serine protease AprX